MKKYRSKRRSVGMPVCCRSQVVCFSTSGHSPRRRQRFPTASTRSAAASTSPAWMVEAIAARAFGNSAVHLFSSSMLRGGEVEPRPSEDSRSRKCRACALRTSGSSSSASSSAAYSRTVSSITKRCPAEWGTTSTRLLATSDPRLVSRSTSGITSPQTASRLSMMAPPANTAIVAKSRRSSGASRSTLHSRHALRERCRGCASRVPPVSRPRRRSRRCRMASGDRTFVRALPARWREACRRVGRRSP